MITLNDAGKTQTFLHVSHTTGRTGYKQAARCRRNGATKTWKKWPGLFRIPVMFGLREAFYIQNFNDTDPDVPAPAKKGSLQNRNDHLWCVPERWEAERVLFEGVTP